MFIRIVNLIFLAAGLSVICATPARAEDGSCDSILSIGMNYSGIKTTEEFAYKLYKSSCNGSSSKSGFSLTGGATDILSSWSIGGGSNSEKTAQFCKLADAKFSGRSELDFEQRTADPAVVGAWQACVEMDKQVAIRVSQSPAGVTISLRRRAGAARFMGVYAVAGKVECVSTIAGADSRPIDFMGVNPNFELREDASTITCSRKPETDNSGNQFYDRAEISVSTSEGFTPIVWPRSEKYGPEEGAALRAELAAIREKMDSDRKKVEGIATARGSDKYTKLYAESNQREQGHTCPPGYVVSGIVAIDKGNTGPCFNCLNGIGVYCRPVRSP